MTPDEIRQFLGREFPQLISSPRRNPDGCSFHYERKSIGRRIIRATRSSLESGTKLLLSISNRLGKENVLIDFDGNEEQLRHLVEHEIKFYFDYFAGDLAKSGN